MSRGGAERETHTESKAGSRLWAVSTESDAGFELTNREITTWAEVGRPTDWATQAPPDYGYILEVEKDLTHDLVLTSLTFQLKQQRSRWVSVLSAIKDSPQTLAKPRLNNNLLSYKILRETVFAVFVSFQFMYLNIIIKLNDSWD